jgi:hypothetical protein
MCELSDIHLRARNGSIVVAMEEMQGARRPMRREFDVKSPTAMD